MSTFRISLWNAFTETEFSTVFLNLKQTSNNRIEADQVVYRRIWSLAMRGPANSIARPFTCMLPRFLQTLHESGRAELSPDDRDLGVCVREAGKDSSEMRQVLRLLEGWHVDAVLDLPGPALAFHPAAALQGAILLFRAACLVSFREMGESQIHELLPGASIPDESNPAAHFSADLCLRHWPDLYRMARACSNDDPLVKLMHELAAGFPLSSLGMNLPVAADSPVLRHPGLRQFFAERALERADHACLAVPEIGTFVRLKLGAYAATLGRGLLSPALES